MNGPKAELHVHLEGTISPQRARILAARNHSPFPSTVRLIEDQQYLSHDFLDFLRVYDDVAFLIKSPQDYYDITFDYLKARALEHTLYVEMMYSPDHAEKATSIPSIEHLYAIEQAIKDAQAQYQIVGRIILTAVRHFGAEAAVRVAKEITRASTPSVVGFGLGGDELNFPPELFQKAYQIAADAGLKCTIHAGEFGQAETMKRAILELPISRIGHGVQAIHSAEVRALLKEKNIALELCPTSNIYLNIFKDMASHPFPLFLAEGIRLSINSDDPPFMGTTLAAEYQRVQQAYQYDDEQMLSITRMAIEDSFADPVTKQALLARLG